MSIPSQNMALTIWDSPDDPYSHTQLAANWTTIDLHDHSPGRGKRIVAGSLAAGAVTTPALGDGAVTTLKIADGSITRAKMAPNVLDPVGTIIAWWRPNDTVDPPEDWEVCLGQVLDPGDHDFPVAGAIQIPDLRGRFLQGADVIDAPQTYSEIVVTVEDVQVYLKLNEQFGTIAYGHQNKNGNIRGAEFQQFPALVPESLSLNPVGDFGLGFDGVTTEVELQEPADLTNAKFTIDFWVKVHNLKNQRAVFSHHSSNALRKHLHILLKENGAIKMDFYDEAIETGPGIIQENRKYNISITYNHLTRRAKIFVNGRKQADTTDIGPFEGDTIPHSVIGALQTDVPGERKFHMDGVIGNFSITAAELTEADMTFRFQAADPVTPFVGEMGGTNFADLSHVHAVDGHNHTIPPHRHKVDAHHHKIAGHGYHRHRHNDDDGNPRDHRHRSLKVRKFKNSDSESDGLELDHARVPNVRRKDDHDRPMRGEGHHNHGGRSGRTRTRTNLKTLTTDSQALITSPAITQDIDARPAWAGVLMLMKVRNP